MNNTRKSPTYPGGYPTVYAQYSDMSYENDYSWMS